MAISKAEAIQNHQGIIQSEVASLEKKVDDSISCRYDGSPLNIQLNNHPTRFVWELVKRKYHEAGWEIEIHTDQREGTWVTLK